MTVINCALILSLCLIKWTSTLDIRNMITYHDKNLKGSMMVTVHKTTRDVFVSARNIIYKFDENLVLKEKATTGPSLDSPGCLHPDYPCPYNRKLTDNDPKVFIIYYGEKNDVLLHCGTLFQGMCSVRSTNNIQISHLVGMGNDTMNFIAGMENTVAFFGPGPEGRQSLYSASTYDHRPRAYMPVSVSSKVLKVNGAQSSFRYSFKSETAHTGVNIHPRYQAFQVVYTYGFTHGNFSYFLTNQLVSLENTEYETRLARVCNSDLQFFSYTELALKCHRGDAYNLALTAYLGNASRSLQQRLKTDESAEVLLVAFARSLPGSLAIPDKSKGTVVCSFPMSLVVSAFANATRDCYNAEPRTYLLKQIVDEGRRCKSEERDSFELDEDLCGSSINPYIEGREAIPGGVRCHIDNLVTSMASVIQFNKTALFLGDLDGNVTKVILERTNVQPLYVVNLNTGNDTKVAKIWRTNAFGINLENLYLLTENKVVKFPVGSCTVYQNCGSCLSQEDPLNCGWCGSYCAHREECETPDLFTRKACPPLIYEVAPVSGPTAGGTVLTIVGDNFGSNHVGEHNAEINVTVAGLPCTIFVWSYNMVKCTTKSSPYQRKGRIVVKVLDVTWSLGLHDINGTATSLEDFYFMEPKVFAIYPANGPVSGGTNITVVGTNIHVGSERTIQLAGTECAPIVIHSSRSMSCLSGPEVTNSTKKGPVRVTIDKASFKLTGNVTQNMKNMGAAKEFEYMPDPDIYAIHPLVTTVSGSMNMTVTGTHLDSAHHSHLLVIVTSPITGKVKTYSMHCDTLNSTIMTCPIPAIDTTVLHEPTDKAPIVSRISFSMDDVKKLKQFPVNYKALSQLLYYPDPEYIPLDENTRKVPYNQAFLEIKGKNLDLAHTARDIQVTIDGSASCVVTDLTIETVTCIIPPVEELKSGNDTFHSVEVRVGKFHHHLGYLEFVESPSDKQWGGLIAIPLLLFIAIVVFLVVRYVRRRKRRMKHPNFMVSFMANEEDNSCQDTCANNKTRKAANDYQDTKRRSNLCSAVVHQDAARNRISNSLDDETLHLLQAENILVDRQYLSLGDVIGQGYFGCVYFGQLQQPGEEKAIDVAVKTLRDGSPVTQDVEAFLQEGLLMKDFRHKNVLSLIGVCYEPGDSPMVIMPYMKHGDLLSFIGDEAQNPSVKNLMTFGIDVASGMKYLSELKFVHRDLAARNCMLSEDMSVKVADFGLSRDIYERDYYTTEQRTRLPVKWMAPESLEKGNYTTKSDVWSYGVVLWELMTRGVLPYPDVDNWDMLPYLKSGRRMPQPSFCPDLLFEIMLQCWSEDSQKRPTFAELEVSVRGVLTKLQLENMKATVSLNVTYVNYKPYSRLDGNES